MSRDVECHQRKQFLKTKLATPRQIQMFQQNHKAMFSQFGFCIIDHNMWTRSEMRVIKQFERSHLPQDVTDVTGREWKSIFNLFVCLFDIICSLHCCADNVFGL